MSFWNGLRRAFGFSPEGEDEEEGEYDPTVPTYAANKPTTTSRNDEERPAVTALPAPRQEADSEPASPTSETKPKEVSMQDDTLAGDIFDALINLFNDQQPEFIKNCLSTDEQRKYILNSIDESLRNRMATACDPTHAAKVWENQRTALERRIAALQNKEKDTETLRQENRRLQLSVDRQKRALLDRINDLESQVAKLNADKERMYTDKKLPVDTQLLDKAHIRIAELEEEVKRQTTLREQLEVKTKMSDAMINDLRKQAAPAREELEKNVEEQESIVAQIQEQLEGVEALKARKDARITELQEALNAAKAEDWEGQVAKLNEENNSLRRTIENNLYNQANSEMRLRSEIKELRQKLESRGDQANDQSTPQPTAPQEDRPASRRRGRPKKVRIDSDLDNTEWFAGGKKDDPDFGYHEPPRRPVNDNEAQLSLF